MKKKVEEEVPAGAMTSDGVLGNFHDNPKFSAKNPTLKDKFKKKRIIRRTLAETENSKSVNKHIAHLEEFCLDDTSIEFFDNFFDSLDQQTSDITVKVDGAPALFFGHDDGEFFIGTKSILNKVPKLIKSSACIDKHYHDASDELKKKLLIALDSLRRLDPPKDKVYQGDMLFTRDDLVIDEDKISFTPNTIEYSVTNRESDEYQQVLNSDMGFMIHTEYKNAGKTDAGKMDLIRVPLSKSGLTIPPKAFIHWIQSIDQKTLKLPNHDYIKHRISLLNSDIKSDSVAELKIFVNKLIREDIPLLDVKPSFDAAYIKHINDKYQIKKDKLKTQKGKDKIQEKIDSLLNENSGDLNNLVTLHDAITTYKLDLIKALHNSEHMMESEYSEGFVVDLGDNLVKLVDRYVFSKNNFNNDKFGTK